jgi:type II secretory pathway component GspD/PulD (secretin)
VRVAKSRGQRAKGKELRAESEKPYALCSIAVLLCLFAIGCASKTSQIEQAEKIIDDIIESAEETARDELRIARIPRYAEEEDGIHITIENGKLSCDLVNADLRKTLLKIADVAQLQFVFSENIYGRVNAKFSNLALEEGIRLILGTRYIFEKKAGVYSVRKSPDASLSVKYHEVQLRYVTVEQLMKRVAAFYRLPFKSDQQSTGGQIGRPEGMVEMQPFAGPTSLMMKDVTIVKAIERNVLLISGESSRMDEVLELITALDQKVPQVLIETYLVEYDEEALRESGIDLSFELIRELSSLAFNVGRGRTDDIFTLPAITSILSLPAIAEGAYKRVWEDDATDGTEGGTEDSAEIAARIHSLMDENKLTVISRPYVIVSNRDQAFISAASEQYVIAAIPGQSLATGTLERVKTTTSFTILPTIISDNKVYIQLSLEQSEFTTPRSNAVLSTNRNTARTSLVVKDGETIIIGGVNSSREATGNRGVPVLRSIPVLKYVFGASKRSSSSRKVNFYITPHILPLEEEIIREKIKE